MQRIVVSVVAWVFLGVIAQAQPAERLETLFDALGLPEMLEIIHSEGLEYGETLGQEMLDGKAGAGWQENVADIYDIHRNSKFVFDEFSDALDPKHMDAMLDFFQSPVGIKIVALEVAARRALLDDDLSDENDAHVANLREQGTPKMAQLTEFIQVNDLLEINVVGSLNSNFEFFKGLVDGGAYEQPLSEDKILQEVWAQEASIRADTEIWLYGFLSLAYSPLDEGEMQAYVDFSRTKSGQHLNSVLFSVFNQMFDQVSYALGRSAAQVMQSEAL